MIKIDMKMPKSCRECSMGVMRDGDCHKDWAVCHALPQYRDDCIIYEDYNIDCNLKHDYYNKRHPLCPLIEVKDNEED